MKRLPTGQFLLVKTSEQASNDGVRTTINIDDNLLKAAAEFTGIDEKARLVNTVFEKFVAWESAKRIRKLAGSAPDLDLPARSERLSPPAQFLNEPEPPFNK